MKISVIIPTYKPDDTLFFCLDSLNIQSLSINSFEIILILNGPKEGYEKKIKDYIKESSLNIRYFYTQEQGVSNARNLGIKEALGEYVTFIDSDDWVSEKYLEGLLARTNKDNMVIANVRCYNPKNKSYYTDFISKKYNSIKLGQSYSHLVVRSYFSVPWAKLIPTEICKRNYFSTKFEYGEDALYMFSIEPYLPRCIKSDEDVAYFRREVENSLSRKKRSYKEIFSIHLKLLFEYWKIYLSNIKKYNFIFFMLRNLAVLKHILVGK